jgi:hypothetical protein
MANRRISELPLLDGTQIAEQDLFTLVHVFEVDPTLKNKKLTISGFNDYLKVYYVTTSGGTINGSLTVQNTITAATGIFGNIVFPNSIISGDLFVYGSGYFGSGISVTGTISGQTVTGLTANFITLSGTTVTGITANFVSGIFSTQLSGKTITGDVVQATNITGATVVGTTFISGATVTGNTGQFTNITGGTAGFTTVTGTTVTGTTANFVTVSGTTVTGTNGRFTNITGTTLHITTPSGVTPALICSGVVSGNTAGFIIQGPLIILP